MSGLILKDGTPEHPLPFVDKIMYGSDWFMPLGNVHDRSQYLAAYKELLAQQGAPAYVKFFLANALRFMNVDQRVASKTFPLDAQVRDRLMELSREAQRRLGRN